MLRLRWPGKLWRGSWKFFDGGSRGHEMRGDVPSPEGRRYKPRTGRAVLGLGLSRARTPRQHELGYTPCP